MARIYVSSTFSDLEEHRKGVSLALRRLGHEDVAMEYYVAEDRRPLDRCLSDVSSCDLYVGIFAWRYGYVPQDGNLDERSITELEYQAARDKGIPCLIFLLSEDAPWPKSKQDKGMAAERIESFRHELLNSERHVVNLFETADELTRKVSEAVIQWEKQSGLAGKRQLTDWDAYRRAVCNKHQWVRLQVIAGASSQRGIAKIPLIEIFEPQLAAPGASRTDVPDEIRRYQEAIYGPKPDEAEETMPPDDDQAQGPESISEPETDDTLLSSNPELVLDILGREPTQVLLGGPGTGKSTILHYAMLRISHCDAESEALPLHLRDAPIPFLIELRKYVLEKSLDFVSYIAANSREFYDCTIEPETLVTVLEQPGQSLVFFDGLDEVFDPNERRRVINQFQTFAHRYPRARIVVTSRIAGYDRTALGLAGFEHYTLLPLTLGQIRHFAGQWYRYYTLEDTERTPQGLVQRIVESPRLLDLAGNPMLLTMMAVIYKDRDLPNERWRLYERCAETLLEDWDLGKGIEDEDFKLAVLVRTAQKSEILQRVSMYMLEHGQKDKELNAISYAPLLDIVASYLEEKYQRPRGDAEAVAVDILRHLMERTYVLAGIGERIFGFVHRTFMEYFAACRCQARFNARRSDFGWLTGEIFGEHWQGGEWEEVLLLLIAMLHDQGTPIREVVEHVRTRCRTEIPFNVAFAARCLGEAGDVQDPSHAQAVLVELAEAIVKYAAQPKKQEARTFVEVALKAFAALAPLVVAPGQLAESINSLNELGTVPARMAAWQMGFALRSRKERLDYALAALHDKEEVVRRGAIAALEREWPGRADIGPVLATVVQKDRHARVRQAALAAMQRSWRDEPTILDAIASRVEDETAYTYVIRLIDYLAVTWRGNAKAIDLVLKLSGEKRKAGSDYAYGAVRTAAAQAIVKSWSSDPRNATLLLDKVTSDADSHIRAVAARALAKGWGDSRHLALLYDRATNDPQPHSRAATFKALTYGWAGDPQAFAFFQNRARNDPEPQNRAAVLSTIADGWRGDLRAVAFVLDRVITDPKLRTHFVVREGLTKAIYHLAYPSQIIYDNPHDLDLLWFFSVDRRSPVALQEFAINSIFAMNAEPDFRQHGSMEREAASVLEALAFLARQSGGSGALDLLQKEATENPDVSCRSVALWAIAVGWKGEPQVLTFLRDRATTDPDAQARLGALSGTTGPLMIKL